jgi:hypothetical protein
MSDEEQSKKPDEPAQPPVPPEPPAPPDPVIPGFEIVQVEDGRWTIQAKGESPWYLTGFEEARHAHQWVLDYLTTNIENSNRINMEAHERRREYEEATKHALAEAMMWSEDAKSKERKIH